MAAKVHPVGSFPAEISVPSSHLIDDSPFHFADEEKPYVLPTGDELMSRPIKEGGQSRFEQEIDFVINNVKTRLDTLYMDQMFETGKWKFFMFALICAMIGLVLVFYGFHLTILFDNQQDNPTDYVGVAFGCVFFIPMLWFFSYLCFPNKQQYTIRKKIKKERRERRKPTAFNTMVAEAEKATEPPPRLIKVIARFRKKDWTIIGSTWKDFCEEFERQTGLPIERQLIRYNDEDLQIDLAKKMDADYGLDNFSKVFIYNKGGLFTQNDPRRLQYEEIHEAETRKLNAMKDEYARKQREEQDRRDKVMNLFKKVAGGGGGGDEKRRKSMGSREGSAGGGRRSSVGSRPGSTSDSTTNVQSKPSFKHSKASRASILSDDSEGDYSSDSSRKYSLNV
jgi:hypothetical protein